MKRGHPNPGIAYSKALDALEVAERKMARAFNVWNKARLALGRADKRLNKAQRAEVQ